MKSYLEAIISAETVESLWATHTAKMAEFGFDRIIYGHTHFRSANSLGDPQDMLVLTNHGQEYMSRFIDEGLYFHAPMVRWALENDGACSWRWMEEQLQSGGFTPSERKVVEFNQQMDVRAGYSISFRSISFRAKAAIALTAKPGMSQDEVEDVWAAHGRDLTLMNNVMHLKVMNLPYAGNRRPLTKRQKEALEWVGDGKTMQDIAQIMGLTPATIEKHLRLAREVLDVETTAQAVLKASFQNQIFVIEG